MAETTKLERMNFFRGFFTTAEDWRAEQEYHRRKHRLHNEFLHNSPGVVRGQASELDVDPGEAGLTLRVQPGMAVDAHGDMLILDAPRQLSIDLQALGGQTADQAAEGAESSETIVYVAISFSQHGASWVDNFEQPDYSGYTRISETPAITITTKEPDNREALELARIRLEPAAQSIGKPEPGKPAGPNEIDRSHVVWAVGVAEQEARLHDVEASLEQVRKDLEKTQADLQKKLDAVDRRLVLLRGGYGWLDYYRLLHGRGLVTPGVIAAIPERLRVEPAGGFDIRVLPGVAIDGAGELLELHTARVLRIDPQGYKLPAVIFVTARHANGYDPGGKGGPDPGAGETVDLALSDTQPDNRAALELARVHLVDDDKGISAPQDPEHPGGNQIDLRHVETAGSVGIQDAQLSVETRDRVIQLMRRTRRDFAALGARFPVTSEGDVRHAALTVETVLRVGRVRPGQLPQVLRALASVERDVGHELVEKYGEPLRATDEYNRYMDAVRELEGALQRGNEEEILNAGEAVSAAARELSQIVVSTPVADAGNDLRVSTPDDETIVTLNGSASWARGGREIDTYIWRRVEGE